MSSQLLDKEELSLCQVVCALFKICKIPKLSIACLLQSFPAS